jgi:hypothetical protein
MTYPLGIPKKLLRAGEEIAAREGRTFSEWAQECLQMEIDRDDEERECAKHNRIAGAAIAASRSAQ